MKEFTISKKRLLEEYGLNRITLTYSDHVKFDFDDLRNYIRIIATKDGVRYGARPHPNEDKYTLTELSEGE